MELAVSLGRSVDFPTCLTTMPTSLQCNIFHRTLLGGLVCQGLVQDVDGHNVHTLVTLSSPLNGQFGVPDFVSSYLPFLKGKRESLSGYVLKFQ